MPPIEESSPLKVPDNEKIDWIDGVPEKTNLEVITTQPEKKVVSDGDVEALPQKQTDAVDCLTCVMLCCDALTQCWIACISCVWCCDGDCCTQCLNGTVEGLGECMQGCGECCLHCTECC